VRRRIRNLLDEREDIKVVGEAATFSEAIQKSAELQLDEIIVDLRMADDAKRSLSCWPDGISDIFCKR
jgi:DNA-binding NarL/FixJ family response regulator